MNTAKELNKLCKAMTGKDSNATTDAQAIKNIADNYSGGGSTGAVTYVINHVGDPQEETEVTNETELSQLNAIIQGALSGNVINCILRQSYTQEETEMVFIYGLKGINPQEFNDEYISIKFNGVFGGVSYTYLDNKWYVAYE